MLKTYRLLIGSKRIFVSAIASTLFSEWVSLWINVTLHLWAQGVIHESFCLKWDATSSAGRLDGTTAAFLSRFCFVIFTRVDVTDDLANYLFDGGGSGWLVGVCLRRLWKDVSSTVNRIGWLRVPHTTRLVPLQTPCNSWENGFARVDELCA